MPDKTRELFSPHVSSGAIRKIDGATRVIGKFGQIEMLDDIFDIWLVKPDLSPLTEHKITAIIKKCPLELGFTRLTGEAYAQTPDFNTALGCLVALGIRKRKQVSGKTLEHLKNIRGS